MEIKQMIVDTSMPYSSRRLEADLLQLKESHPFIRLSEIGRSFLGKPIYEVRVGSGEKKIHFNGAFHANEWITSLVLMRWLEDFLSALVRSEKIGQFQSVALLLSAEISIVPMVNPDGVDLVTEGAPANWLSILRTVNKGSDDFSQWKANIRGVDLNNQYPTNWEIEKERKAPKGPASRDFPGYAPLTEPEALALARLTEKACFDRVLALHTQGEEFYWGYEGLQPQESKRLAEEFERISGYQAIEMIDSHAGFKDWFIQKFHKPGFTIELGYGENPLPLSQFDKIYADVRDLLSAAIFL